MADKDFLSFLVDETFKLQKNGEVQLSSLEHKLNDYGLKFFKGEFIPQSQMLRFETHLGVIDAPMNWSVFSINNVHGGENILTEENDPDHFFKVMKLAWDHSLEKILITHSEGFCYLVGLKVGDETYLHDILHPQEWLKSA